VRKKIISLRRRNAKAFTLVEIMVVVVIIGMLAGIVSVNVMSRLKKARVTTAKTQISQFESAIESFHMDTGQYPSDTDGLLALIDPPPGIGADPEGYLKNVNEIPKDPWGNEYQYVYPGQYAKYDIFSYGADGKEGGQGYDADIYNSDISESNKEEGV